MSQVPSAVMEPTFSTPTRLVLVSSAYFASQVCAFAFPESFGLVAAIWPAAGIALASLLLGPRRLWPALLGCLFAAGLAANLTTPRPFGASVGFMLANICETAASAWLITRWRGNEVRFSRLQDVLVLAVAACLVNACTALVGAGVASLVLDARFGVFYLTWWVSNGLGLLLVTPLIVLWAYARPRFSGFRWGRIIEAMALFLLSCTAVWFVFGQEGVASPVELRPYMLSVFVIWAALRFGPRGTVTLLGMFSVIVIVCTAAGIGSFPLRGANPSLRLLAVQVYLAVVALTGMVLAVVVAQQEESRFLLHAVVEGTSDAVYVKDRRGRYVLFNAASARVTGRKASEVIGNDDTFLFPPDEAKVVMQEDQTVMASAAVRTYEERVTGGAGQSLVFLSTKGPLHSKSGEVFGLFGIARDITERKRAEEQKARLEAQVQEARKMESVGRLAGGVAHNYNNRLAGILNYVELCRDSLPPEHPVRGYLDEITSDAQHAADLTRQLLSFACKQTIAPRVIDLNDTVANMLGLLRSLLGVKIGMVWCPGAGVWPVKLDPSQVGQLLANLCANAHDAIEAVGGVGQVTIETGHTVVDQARCAGHPDAVPGDYVLLAVSDSGGGMDKKDVSRVFEPFFNTPVPGVGTGLALASAYGIVRQNRGFIEVSSESGRGTCFRILLPRAVLS